MSPILLSKCRCKISTLSLAYLQGQLQHIIDCHLFLFFLLPNSVSCSYHLQLMLIFVLGYNNIYLFLLLSSIKKILYFCGPGDNKESFIDVPEWGRERKKWPCFMHVCILSCFVQRYVGSLPMPQSFASYIANAVFCLSEVNHVCEKLISISQYTLPSTLNALYCIFYKF